jgi:membrane-bound lytic murein transglycosylase B
MKIHVQKIIFSWLMITTITLGTTGVVFAQASNEAQLRAELEVLQREIAQKEAELGNQKKNSASLGRDVSVLRSQIDKAKLQIQAKQKMIASLGGQINQKENRIEELADKKKKGENTLAQILRKKYQLEQTTLPELFLANVTISDYFLDSDVISSMNKSLQNSFNLIRRATTETNKEKEILEEKKDAEADVKYSLEQDKKQVEVKESEKNKLLADSKNKEKSYEQIIKERKARADKIRAELFRFAGGSTKAIPFGTALEYAKAAERSTGTPAAFVLAILTQESALGANVGQCYISSANDGTGTNKTGTKTFTNVMSPKRDIPPFLKITERLGRDPYKTAISCPIAGVAGWGGAMGPAQFIPSTWQGVSSRVSAITGSSDPWSARDSITASSLYLSDLGAGGGYSGQIRAACRYYGTGGSSCSYGTQVMGRVSKIQANIDILEGN